MRNIIRHTTIAIVSIILIGAFMSFNFSPIEGASAKQVSGEGAGLVICGPFSNHTATISFSAIKSQGQV